jgi:hypothetical protein
MVMEKNDVVSFMNNLGNQAVPLGVVPLEVVHVLKSPYYILMSYNAHACEWSYDYTVTGANLERSVPV